MKVTVGQEALAAIVGRVCGPALEKTSMPVLNNLLLETEGKAGMRVSANNLALGMSSVVACKVEKAGSVTVPAKTLRDISRAMPKGKDVTLEVDDNSFVELRSGKVRYKVGGIPAEDFPELLSAGDDPVVVELAVSTLRTLVDATAHAVSPDESRPHLNAALLEAGDGIARLVATDGHCLSKHERPVNGVPKATAMISKAMIRVLQPMLKELDDEEPVEVVVGKTVVMFKSELEGEEVVLAGKSTDARFPPYDKVIPKQHTGTLKVAREAFVAALTRAGLVSTGKALAITVSPEGSLLSPDGTLKVRGDNPDVGEGEEEVVASFDGPEGFTFGIDQRLLLNAVRAVSDEDVQLKLNGATDAVVIVGGDDDPFGVVMPMRL
jgi:DNA polymerase-3 subunit beta